MNKNAVVALIALTLASVSCSSTPSRPAPAPPPPPAQVKGPVRPMPPIDDEDALFSDSFEEFRPEWQQSGGIWEVAEGSLLQKADDPRELYAYRWVQTKRFSDATVEMEVSEQPYVPSVWSNSEADSEHKRSLRYVVGAGIIFRRLDRSNFYMFRLAGEENAVLAKMVDGDWKDIASPRLVSFLGGSRIKFGETLYKLKVTIRGSRIQCFVNDGIVIDITEPGSPIGQVGLVTFKTAADFRSFRVTK